MDQLRIIGGRPLKGVVPVSGSKNAALPIMAACILAQEPVTLRRVPDLRDVQTMQKLLAHLGATIERDGEVLRIDPNTITGSIAPYDLVRTMRASFVVLGPLAARMGYAEVALPGGCAIGVRPVDIHVFGLEALGMTFEPGGGVLRAYADNLRGAEIALPMPSVGATQNIMMAATAAAGETIIANAACEPEVVDLANFLTTMGAHVEGAGTSIIRIEGEQRMRGAEHMIIADRIEAATWLIAAAITNSNLTLRDVDAGDVAPVIAKLREAGIQVRRDGATLRVSADGERRPVNIRTEPHPGFPTDAQAQMTALCATIPGTSTISETIFENRFMHVSELQRMGANIRLIGNNAIVTGPAKLTGAPVMASDLRASAALVLAGLVAEGETVVQRIYHLDRGYERLEEKLRKLGACIERIPGGSV